MNISSVVKYLGQPCRNFNFQTMLVMVDPADGREKLVLSNYVGGGLGSLILIDAGTHAAEEIHLPADGGAWALAFAAGKYLIVGTNMDQGLVCRLDLTTRTWAEPLHNEKTTYHWNVAQASDGLYYFTTYPTAEILQYDPVRHSLRSIGKPSNNSGNFYSKEISGAYPGWVVVSGGFAESYVSAWEIATGSWFSVATGDPSQRFTLRDAGGEVLHVERDGVRECYSIPGFRPLTPPEGAGAGDLEARSQPTRSSTPGMYGFSDRLSDGRLAGVAGQEYFIETGDGERVYHRIPFDPPPTGIHRSLVMDNEGDIWGPCSFGQTIFRYRPGDESYWNSLAVCDYMGEVYGMVARNGLLFLSCYAGGDHVVYDPKKAWDQHGNVNPRTLDKVSDRLCRAVGGCTVGPDGAVWTGWRAKYGLYGGALSRVDPESFELQVWDDPIPAQTVMGVAADETHLYFTTNPSGEGLPLPEDVPGWFCVWHPQDGLQAKYEMGPGGTTAGLAVQSGRVFIIQGDRLAVFDPAENEFRSEIALGGECGSLVVMDAGILAAICGTRLVWVDTRAASVLGEEILETGAFGIVPTKDGRSFYFACGLDFYHLQPPDLWSGRD